MNLSKLITILSKRRDTYQANADELDRILTYIITNELHKNLDLKTMIYTIDESELGPDKRILEEVTMAQIEQWRRNESV